MKIFNFNEIFGTFCMIWYIFGGAFGIFAQILLAALVPYMLADSRDMTIGTTLRCRKKNKKTQQFAKSFKCVVPSSAW